jgi:hypothetical protein
MRVSTARARSTAEGGDQLAAQGREGAEVDQHHALVAEGDACRRLARSAGAFSRSALSGRRRASSSPAATKEGELAAGSSDIGAAASIEGGAGGRQEAFWGQSADRDGVSWGVVGFTKA